jgi:hypothetical protein
LEHTFVLGFVGHNQAQLLVALPAQTLEHLLKPQQQLLERSLERIGRRDCGARTTAKRPYPMPKWSSGSSMRPLSSTYRRITSHSHESEKI